ncbi:hypothetical protein DPEC_G00254110 [Dallia pectoralis]|uniref:Uncharacterized protein n=1 Tax=Dallia pectoralis TaxID=75939 RepID=A0ACC2FU53_DALPE|nr:hypothetical protein DPEC_G00254110 [Dallia pectoralis]
MAPRSGGQAFRVPAHPAESSQAPGLQSVTAPTPCLAPQCIGITGVLDRNPPRGSDNTDASFLQRSLHQRPDPPAAVLIGSRSFSLLHSKQSAQ